MSKAIVPDRLLARQERVSLSLDGLNVTDLKKIARFWFGTTASNKLRRSDCVRALIELFKDKARLQEGLQPLKAQQRQILGIFKLYGGSVSGPLLLCEVLARQLVEPSGTHGKWYEQRKHDPVLDLCDKLLLVPRHGRPGHFSYHYQSSYRRCYPDLVAAPGVLDGVQPASSLAWTASVPAPVPHASHSRPAAEITLDLMNTAQAMQQSGGWKTNKGGSLAKSMQNRLQKLLPQEDRDPMAPPAPESLYYEILRGVGAVHVEHDQGNIDMAAVERHLCQPGTVQAWNWVRAWTQARLWQDGIGVVPDRDNHYEPVRIDPEKLATARELLAWALCRVAHGNNDWLDLETFLVDLCSATAGEIDFYWHAYSWRPDFRLARDKDKIPVGDERSRAFWLDDKGMWAANAIMGTLAHLGLVERGQGKDRQHCFRLTELGQAVFGAPEQAIKPIDESKFLTVQPNHDVLAYLDAADAGAIWPLARMAHRTSGAGERVQTFALTRESIYEAMESGLSIDTIRTFLQEHSKTGLPDNVAHSLSEWGRRRESLVIRSEVTLAATPTGRFDVTKGKPVGERFLLLPKTAGRGFKDCHVRDHHGSAPHRPWCMEEDGQVTLVAETDSLAMARLAQFAEKTDGGWKITAASVERARARGITAEQVLAWLAEHLTNETPPIIETMIRNWAGKEAVFLGPLVMLQVTQSQACAALRDDERFRPLVLAHVPPDWFVVSKEKQAELKRLLGELGFSIADTFKPTRAAGDPNPEGVETAKVGRRRRRRREGP